LEIGLADAHAINDRRSSRGFIEATPEDVCRIMRVKYNCALAESHSGEDRNEELVLGATQCCYPAVLWAVLRDAMGYVVDVAVKACIGQLALV
jgi:hypothetical protein